MIELCSIGFQKIKSLMLEESMEELGIWSGHWRMVGFDTWRQEEKAKRKQRYREDMAFVHETSFFPWLEEHDQGISARS